MDHTLDEQRNNPTVCRDKSNNWIQPVQPDKSGIIKYWSIVYDVEKAECFCWSLSLALHSREINQASLWDHNSLPPCASVVFHHVSPSWWKDCQLFILPLCINPSSAYRKSQALGPRADRCEPSVPATIKRPLAFLQQCFPRPQCVTDTSSHDENTDRGHRFINHFPHLHTRWWVLDGSGIYMSFYRGGLWKMQQEMKNKRDGEDQTGPFLSKLERERIEYIIFS